MQLVDASDLKSVKVRVRIPPSLLNAPVAQLEEALDLGSRQCRFESYRRYHAPVAQSGQSTRLSAAGPQVRILSGAPTLFEEKV